MNDPHPPNNQLRFALAVLGIIAVLCIGAGAYLLVSGYQSGELFVGIVGSIAGAIAGMLSMRSSATPPKTTDSGALATEVTNAPNNPLPVTETQP